LYFPNIDWNLYTTNANNYPLRFCQKLIVTLLYHSLAQLVDIPTRKENILSIFATNRPSLVADCKAIPGISDHEAVLVMSNVSVKMQPPVTRKIFLWRKANFNTIREKIQQFSDSYFSSFSHDQPVSTLWDNFKSLCYDCRNLIKTLKDNYHKKQPSMDFFFNKTSLSVKATMLQ